MAVFSKNFIVIKNIERNNGKITKIGNSGTAEVGFGNDVCDDTEFGKAEVETEPLGIVIVSTLVQSLDCPVKI